MSELTTAQRSKIRRLSQPKELAPDEEGGELNIVPFLDIIMNILIFVLAPVAVTFTATIDTTPPASKSSGVRSEVPSEALNLTVISYLESIDFGFLACRELLPDLDALAHAVPDALAELVKLVDTIEAPTPAAPATTRRAKPAARPATKSAASGLSRVAPRSVR